MSGVDLTDQFLQYYSFLHKSVKWSKKFFVHCLNMIIPNAHILHKKYSDSKRMHWHFRIKLVKHVLSIASNCHRELYQYQTLLTVPSTWLINTLLSPIPSQEGGGRKHPSHACFVCNVSKEALSDAGFGDSYKPKKYASYWCSICKCALCIDPCFSLYHTEKDYTSEIVKIVIMSVKLIQKDAQHV